MKKILCLVLVVLLSFCALAACGKKATPTAPSGTNPPAEGTTPTPEPEVESGYIILEEIVEYEEFGVGFRKADYALALKVQEILDEMFADGTSEAISIAWFGEQRILDGAQKEFPREAGENEADESLDKVIEAGTLKMGLDVGFAPMGFYDDDNNIIGFDIDLAKAVCEKLGVELELVSIDWASKEAELDNGNIDCIWNGLTINEKRIPAVFFTKPYLSNAQVVIVPKDSEIAAIADLAGKNIGLQKGSSALEAIEGHDVFADIADVAEYADNFMAFEDLKNGRIDALVIDKVMGDYLLSKQ